MSHAPDAGSTADARPSVGELLGDVSRDLSQLVHQEIELAKAEAKQSATQAGKGAGMLAGAGTAAHLGIVFISVALWWGIGNATGRGWSALIVAALWLIIGGVLALLGKKQLSTVRGLDRTTETVKKIPPALKPDEGNAR